MLTVVDMFSKKIVVRAGKSQTPAAVAAMFEAMLPEFAGPVRTVKTDQGKEFLGPEFQKVLADHEIKYIKGQPHAPQGQGGVERANATIKRMITSAEDQLHNGAHTTFAKAVKLALKAYNGSKCDETGCTPNQLNYNQLPPSILKAVRDKLVDNAQGVDSTDKYHPPLKAGDKVRIDYLLYGQIRARGDGTKYTSVAALAKQHSSSFKPSHKETWSRETYTVRTVFPATNSASLVEDVHMQHTDAVKRAARASRAAD